MLVRGDIWEIAREDGVLTELQRGVLERRELLGMSWSQIAYAMGLHTSTVRGHYRGAQRRLALELERRSED
jgi:DNA-directed RNA polymerase specialized sigma24 family protein